MAAITLKEIPKELHRALKKRAAHHRRSLNSEIIACLEQVMGSERIDPETLLTRARLFRSQVRGSLNDRELFHLKDQGRP